MADLSHPPVEFADEQEGQRCHSAPEDVSADPLRAGVSGEHHRAEHESGCERGDDREDHDLAGRA